MYGIHSRRNGIRWRPRSLEQVQADFASLEMHIRVADGREKADSWRCQRVRVWDLDVEFPETACGHVSTKTPLIVDPEVHLGMQCLPRLSRLLSSGGAHHR